MGRFTRASCALIATIAALLSSRPRAQDAQAGGALFAEQCASCHGADARGQNGPNLTTLWASGATDERVFQTIRRGVPGSVMPPSNASDDQIRGVIAYLKSLAAPSATSPAGNAPIERPQVVTLVTREGRQIRGEWRNEDAFSIQIAETNGRLQGYMKEGLREILRGDRVPAGGAGGPGGPGGPRGTDATTESASSATLSGISYRDILDGLKDPSRWLTYSGDYSARRHSPLTQITPSNVHRLAPEWTLQTGTMTRGRGFEATALAWDGVLYVTGSNNFAWALDARTGRPFWQYRRELPTDLTYGASAPVNRGFGMLGDHLFMVTLDAHLLAFDRRTGRIVWDTVLADYKVGYSATLAPLVIDGKVIVGISGGEYPTRGFLDAYDPQTGKRIWRFYTVPAPGEPGSETWPSSAEVMARGGGGTWTTGSFDPDLNLLYWGTGNPNPDYWGNGREGDNLYTNSLIAIDAATGTLKWHFQFTPHDTHDWDANQIPVLAEVTFAGTPRKVVMVANRNGFFYVFDRRNGALLLAKPFTETTWAREVDRRGRPIVLNDGSKGCLPDQWGGTNFNPPSFDPTLGLFFVNSRETCATYVRQEPTMVPGRSTTGGSVRVVDATKAYGALRAVDPTTGERRWEFRYTSPTMAGVMTTATGLVFAGDHEGHVMAFDSRTGSHLWRYQTGTPIWGAAPMTYMLDGRQRVVVASGTTLVSFALR